MRLIGCQFEQHRLLVGCAGVQFALHALQSPPQILTHKHKVAADFHQSE